MLRALSLVVLLSYSLALPALALQEEQPALILTEEGVALHERGYGPDASVHEHAWGIVAPSALFETRDGRLLVSEAASGRVTDISAERDATLRAFAPVPQLAASTRAWVAALLMGVGLLTLRRFVDPEFALSRQRS